MSEKMRNSAPTLLDLASASLVAGQLALAWYIWRNGPLEPVPTHFGFDGTPNDWSTRGENAALLAVFAGVTVAVQALMIFARNSSKAADPTQRIVLRIVGWFVLTLFTSVTVMAGALALGESGFLTEGPLALRLILAGLSLMWLVLGALAGKAKPNLFVGVRLRWTFESRLAWDRSNRLLGRLMMLAGALGLPIAFLAPPALALSIGIVLPLAAAVWATFEAWRVWRNDPERHAPGGAS